MPDGKTECRQGCLIYLLTWRGILGGVLVFRKQAAAPNDRCFAMVPHAVDRIDRSTERYADLILLKLVATNVLLPKIAAGKNEAKQQIPKPSKTFR
jgi:hypothetical protein